MGKSRSGRDRNLIHSSQLPLSGVAAWKGKGAHEPQQHFQISAASRPLLGPGFWEAPSTRLPKIHPLRELSSTKRLTWIQIHFVTKENKKPSARLRVSNEKTNTPQTEPVPELPYLKQRVIPGAPVSCPWEAEDYLIRNCI